jgi:hypothetical protein
MKKTIPPKPSRNNMKKILLFGIILGLALLDGFVAITQAQVPVATWRWNFNQTNINSTNYIYPTDVNTGLVPDPAASKMGVLRSLDGSGNSVNVLGVPGSGVSSGLVPGLSYDRSVVLPGVYAANSYFVRTPDVSYAITNLGVISNFTITCWAKVETNPPANSFPRIVMFGANGVDAGSTGINAFGILQYNNYDIQLKIHNVSNPNSGNGMSTSSQPLASGATNWVFIAVTYDGTLDSGGTPTGGTNTVFYVGNRNDSFTAPTLAPGVSIIYSNYYTPGTPPNNSPNNVAPGATNSPGYINFDSVATNGNGTLGVSNVFVAIGNRYNGTASTNGGGNRAFNGRYDDIRLYANRVLTLAEVEAVRTNAPPAQPGPLTISQQPASTTVAEGQGAAFTIVVSDAPNRTYQWYRIPKGIAGTTNLIAGATSASLETAILTVAGNNGDKYRVIVHSTDPIADNGGAGATSTFATANVLPVSQYAVTPGMLKFEYYAADAGNSVNAFLAAPSSNYLNNTPDLTLFLPTFDTRTAFPDDSHLDYFVKVSGWITPTVTTNSFDFYIRAGSQAQLYLSYDANVSNTNLIAADNRSGGQVFYGQEIAGTTYGTEFSSPWTLTAGNSYAIVAYLKASVGPNFLQVAWRTDSGNYITYNFPANEQNLADRLKPIPGSSLSCLALPLGTVGISQQPSASPSSTVKANSKVTLNIGVTAVTNTGTGPLVVQWQKNGTNIPDATGTSYTTPYLGTGDSGAQYRAVVSFPGVSSNSLPVTVTVNADDVNPTVVSAASDDLMHSVTVQFSEPVGAGALTATNYSIPGLTVTGAAYAVGTNLVDNPTYDAVKLTTSGQADNTPYTVTVSNVQDTAGNKISSGNTASFRSYSFVPGYGKFEYFENQGYDTSSFLPADDGTVNGFVAHSPKFVNNDPDTIVFPQSLEMSPEGQQTSRSGSTGLGNYPPGFYGTRMSAIITPTNTGNYVFYLATDDTGILWLSTDDNPANKHAIAYSTYTAQNGDRLWSSGSSATNTNTLATLVTVPGATFWPVVDGSSVPIITLTNGQRYYLEVDHRESAGPSSASSVNWDDGTGVAPANGSATRLTGSVIGWHYLPRTQIISFGSSGSNVNISWANTLGPVNLGAAPWPGVTAPSSGAITPSFLQPGVLQSTPSLSPPIVWTTLTNTSPATIPMTNSAQFFRTGE